MWVQILRNVDITRNSNGHISVLLEATITRSGILVVLYVLRMLIWPCLIQGQGHWLSQFPQIALFYVYLLRHFGVELKTDGCLRVTTVCDLVYSYLEPDFWMYPLLGSHATSKFVKCCHHQNPLGFISALPAARSLWLWLQVGHNKPWSLATMTVSPLVGRFYLNLELGLIAFQCTL